MTAKMRLPPQLLDLYLKASQLPEAERGALVACLAEAPAGATPEQVLADTFARLGYLPGEAERAAAKILAAPSQA